MKEKKAKENHNELLIRAVLKEFLSGILILVFIEYLTGTSCLVNMPPQPAFLVVVSLIALWISSVIGFHYLHVFGIIVPYIGLYAIGHCFPELCMELPDITKGSDYGEKIYYLLRSVFKSFGWFLTLGSLALLIHLGVKYGKELDELFS